MIVCSNSLYDLRSQTAILTVKNPNGHKTRLLQNVGNDSPFLGNFQFVEGLVHEFI